MKRVIAAAIYLALIASAIPAAADYAELVGLRTGSMKKLIFHEVPQATPKSAFQREDDGADLTLEDYRGKYVLLNFWATWCAPCRKEMPMLSELQTEFGGEKFEVLTIATGRNSPTGIKKFLDEVGIDNLPRHQDPKQKLASQMGIFGLPITVILNPEGKEIARMRGDADWASDSAKSIIRTMIGDGAS